MLKFNEADLTQINYNGSYSYPLKLNNELGSRHALDQNLSLFMVVVNV